MHESGSLGATVRIGAFVPRENGDSGEFCVKNNICDLHLKRILMAGVLR